MPSSVSECTLLEMMKDLIIATQVISPVLSISCSGDGGSQSIPAAWIHLQVSLHSRARWSLPVRCGGPPPAAQVTQLNGHLTAISQFSVHLWHHRLHSSGLKQSEAELCFLNTARTLELYGVELHSAMVTTASLITRWCNITCFLHVCRFLIARS